ncbi:uncharacterized protein LOC21404164 [Morus notabilis]|uniref:uncharacterized protein LOC21404164 n=1 Tax=Morus notabilis TaxID=981085 RepID=UPI000CED578D|nr:uncharacterized protein LOC21404164 [Morus notabilis]
MAQQDEGWPLGLRPLNARLGLMRSLDFSVGSVSFNTLLTASPTNSSTISSSDLDTQSTGSLFQDRSKTLGSLIGVSSIMELSRKSSRKTPSSSSEKCLRDDEKKSFKLFSLCSNLTTDAVTSATTKSNSNTPSLAHFLEAERRRRATTNTSRRNQYGPTTDYSSCVDYNLTFSESNSLFINGLVAPHQSPAASGRPGVANNNRIFRR